MRDLAERHLCTAAAKASQANCGAHPREILASQSGLRGRRFSSLKNCPPDLLGANPRRRRPCAGFTEHPTAFVLDPGAAPGSAPINAEIRGTFCSHEKLTQWFRSGSTKATLVDVRSFEPGSPHEAVTVILGSY